LKVLEAFENLVDEHRRRLYDAKTRNDKATYGGSSHTAQSAQPSKATSEGSAQYRKAEVERQERFSQHKARTENLARLRLEIRRIEAALEGLDCTEREMLEKEKQARSWYSYFTSPWAQTQPDSEGVKAKKRLDIVQQRTSKGIKLSRTRAELKGREQDHARIVASERQQDAREQALREREAFEERAKQRSREKEEQRQRAEAVRKEAERKSRERDAAENRMRQDMKEREEAARKQQEESELRHKLCQKLAAREKQERAQFRADDYAHDFTFSKPTADFSTSRKASTRTRKKAQAATACRHKKFWPKVEGGRNCSVCNQYYHLWLLQCPDCDKLACGSCRREICGRPARG